MGATKYDFSGWATKNNLKCSDGRTIRKGAFKHNDGQIVPLVWQHQHNDPTNVLGHALLQNREEGVYAFGVFNETDAGLHAKALVQHGDVNALSIYANKLDQRGGDVYHGDIKEVSLVLAGANPGALIDYPILEHSGEETYDEAIIYTGEVISHTDFEDDEEDEEKGEEIEGMKKDYYEDEEEMKEELEHAEEGGEKTLSDVFDTLSDEQKDAVYTIIGELVDGDDDEDEYEYEDSDYSEEGEDEMKHNVFDADTKTGANVLTHDDFKTLFTDAKRLGSLKEAVEANLEEGGVLAHAVYNRDGSEQKYGIADIDYLFPDAKALNNVPEILGRDMDWVAKVMSATHHTPFSRVRSMFANITMEEARARGYLKGKLKKEEVFALLKRSTDPQTIYKKQKLDRDDIIDITDFDVVAWLKREMRMMLEEEIARAILIGDGRNPADDDHISEDHIHSVLNDADLYTLKVAVQQGADDAKTAKNIIKAAVRCRKNYRGSGSPTLFTTEDWLTEMLLLEDGMERPLYDTVEKLATALRVKSIVTVPVMEGVKTKTNHDVIGIIVNLADYNIGADKGGAVAMFDDFDIDYNQQKYLIETRISGALVKPFSAIVLQLGGEDSSPDIPVNPPAESNGAGDDDQGDDIGG